MVVLDSEQNEIIPMMFGSRNNEQRNKARGAGLGVRQQPESIIGHHADLFGLRSAYI